MIRSLKISLINIILMLMIYSLMGRDVWADCLEANPDGSILSVEEGNDQVHVGLILDMESIQGKIFRSIITMAISNFYDVHVNYTTRLVLHARDSRGQSLEALSAALELFDKPKIEALIGGQTTIEEKLFAELGGKARVPVISLSDQVSSPSLQKHPFILQIAQPVISQFEVMAATAEAFNWRDVILIYEDLDMGRDITYLIDSFHGKNVNIKHKRAIASSSTEDEIIHELHQVLTFQSRIIVVHASQQALVSRLFVSAKKVGLMSEGYAWFLTATTTNIMHSADPSTVDSMQGVIGLRPYIPASKGLHNLTSRLRRKFYIENPNMELLEFGASTIRAYDLIWALAKAAEKASAHAAIPRGSKPIFNGIRLDKHKTSGYGSLFLKEILQSRFSGLSGQFQFVNGKLLVDGAFEMVNFVGRGHRRVGLFNIGDKKEGKSEQAEERGRRSLLSRNDLEAIVWPGGSTTIPESRSMLQSRTGAKLRIVVPYKTFQSFEELVHVERDIHSNNSYNVTGYCIDVFKSAVSLLPYQIEFEFLPYLKGYGQANTSYNDLIMEVFRENYDAAVGDITILSNRSKYVDFTQPFSDIGIGLLVRDERSGMWVFLKPFSARLWVTTAGFFVLFGLVIWVVEHANNERFQGLYSEQIGNTLWFAFSTLVFYHSEELKNYLSKFVVIVWVFVVLILTSTYTATLTSMMTVKRIQLDRGTSYIGYQMGSFVAGQGVINNLNFKGLKPLGSTKDFDEALSKGSKHGGVSAIIDEIPYIKIFLARYGNDEFSMIKTASTSNGFGFAFRKGSPLVEDMSIAIEKLRETGELANMERAWFYSKTSLISDDSLNNPTSVDLKTFRGLFIISGSTFAMAILLFVALLVVQNWHFVRDYISELIRKLRIRQ